MKIFILACLITFAFSAQINVQCAAEIAKLTAKLAKLYVDAHGARVPATIRDVISVWKQIKVVKQTCSAEEQMMVMGYEKNLAQCVQDTYQISIDSYHAYQDYETNGISEVVLDDLDSIAHEIPTLIADCDNQEAADHFNEMFPPECIDTVEALGLDSMQIIIDQDHPTKIPKDLIALSKDYIRAKKVCPFLQE